MSDAVLSEYVRIVGFALLYVLALLGWGHLALRLLSRYSEEPFWEFVTARIVAGCTVLYAFFVALSAAGFLKKLPVGAVVGIGFIAGLFALEGFLRALGKEFAALRSGARMDRILIAAALILALLQIVYGLTPLTFYDLQVYHLTGPAEFLRQGTLLAEVPWNVLTNSPLGLQLTLGMSLVLDSAGAVTKLVFVVLGCLLPVAVAQMVPGRAALLAALFVLCYPEFWIQQTLGTVDLYVAALLILGTLWARRSMDTGAWRWIVLAGCAFGFVIASRYQGIVLAALFPAVLVVERMVRKKALEGPILLKFASMAAIAVLFASPWLIRNTIHFGNPVFPLMHGLLGGPGWSDAQALRLGRDVLGTPLSSLPFLQWIMAPTSALITMPSNGLFGMALILGALMAIFLAQQEDVRMAAIFGVCGLLLWSFFHPTPNVHLMRFSAASIGLLMGATAGVLTSPQFPGRRGVHVGLVLAGGSLAIALPFVQSIIPAWQTLLRSDSRAAIWQANVPGWQAFAYVNSELDAAKHKVLVIGETRGFWLHVPFLAPTAFDSPHLISLFEGADPAAWRQKLNGLGISHILVSASEWKRLHDNYDYLNLSSDGIARLNEWFRTLAVVFNDNRGNVVFAL